jgi:competence transcription factor ComK
VVQTFPEVPVYKEDLIQILEDLESLASGQKQYENAVLYRERITELSRQLASENPENLDYKKELALSFKHLGCFMKKQKNRN